MASNRPPATGIVAAALALVCALGLAVFPLVGAGGSKAATLALALVGVGVLVAGLATRRYAGVALAVALFAIEYLTRLHESHEELSFATALYAGGLVLLAELAAWALAEEIHPTPRSRVPRRAGTVAILALAAGGVAAIVVVSARQAPAAGAWLEPVGLAAGLAAIVVIALLARRASLR